MYGSDDWDNYEKEYIAYKELAEQQTEFLKMILTMASEPSVIKEVAIAYANSLSRMKEINKN